MQIKAIGFQVVGGQSSGQMIAVLPKSPKEVLEAYAEMDEFMKANRDVMGFQIQTLHMNGRKIIELVESQYHQSMPVETKAVQEDDDPFARWYGN